MFDFSAKIIHLKNHFPFHVSMKTQNTNIRFLLSHNVLLTTFLTYTSNEQGCVGIIWASIKYVHYWFVISFPSTQTKINLPKVEFQRRSETFLIFTGIRIQVKWSIWNCQKKTKKTYQTWIQLLSKLGFYYTWNYLVCYSKYYTSQPHESLWWGLQLK